MIRQATAAIPMQEPGLAAPPSSPAREAPGNQSWKSNFLAIAINKIPHFGNACMSFWTPAEVALVLK
jgi:hypothetical protein